MTGAASLLKMRFVTLMLAFTASVLTASVADAAETFADCMAAGTVGFGAGQSTTAVELCALHWQLSCDRQNAV